MNEGLAGRDFALAAIRREMEHMAAQDQAAKPPPRPARRQTGPSVVFSIRLDRGELAALEARATAIGLRTTVLARNLIRTGLVSEHRGALPEAIDRLEAALNELRALQR